MPDPQILSAPSQSLRESPALSVGGSTSQRGSPHNGARSGQVAVRSQNKIRIFSGVRRTPIAVSPWLHSKLKDHSYAREGISLKSPLKKITEVVKNTGMLNTIPQLFLAFIKEAAKKALPPMKGRPSSPEGFNISELKRRAGLSSNRWKQLKQNPDNLNMEEAEMLAKAVGHPFSVIISWCALELEKRKLLETPQEIAAEEPGDYGEKKVANHD